MRLSIIYGLISSPLALNLTLKSAHTPASTVTITETFTKTTTVHVPTASGWLPADLTRNASPQKVRARGEAIPKPKGMKKKNNVWIREPDTASLASVKPHATSKKSAIVTVTKSARATATATVYAACQDPRNYVTNVAADAWSAVDGNCDCQAYTTPYSASANNAQECCNLCWADETCIGSLWSPGNPDGQGCLWITAQQCGASQGYNYIEYLNGTKYNENETVSNGPCGLAWYSDA